MTQIDSDTVTLAKGLAICLMVVGHSGVPCSWIGYTIYSFHMPLFFILSGYCFKEVYLEKPVQFVWRKIKGIYLPFVAISLVFLGLHNALYHWHLYDSSAGFGGYGVQLYSMQDFLQQIRYIIISMKCNEDLVGGFWFLKELFWGNLIFYGVLLLTKQIKWVTPLLLLGLTYMMRHTMWHIHFVNVNWMSFYAATFITIGYLLNSYQIVLEKRWILVLLSVLSIGGVYLNSIHMGMTEQTIASCGLYLLTATAASWLIFIGLRNVRMRNTPPRWCVIRRSTLACYLNLAF